MATFTTEAEIEFSVTCDGCGETLDCSEHENYRGGLELKILPCGRCIGEKDEEIKEIKEYYEEELKTLQDELEAVQIETTYNVIKKNE